MFTYALKFRKNIFMIRAPLKGFLGLGLVFAKLVTFATKEQVGLLKMGPPLAFGMIIGLVKALIIELSTPLKFGTQGIPIEIGFLTTSPSFPQIAFLKP